MADNGGEPLVGGEEDESEVEDALGILRMGLRNFGLAWSLGLREGKEMAGFKSEEEAIFLSFGVEFLVKMEAAAALMSSEKGGFFDYKPTPNPRGSTHSIRNIIS